MQIFVKLIASLWRHIDSLRKTQVYLLLLLVILASFAELISFGVVIPFLGVLADPDRFFELGWVQPFINFFGLSQARQLLLPVSLVFVSAVVLSNAIRIILIWTQTRIGHALGEDLSLKIYRNLLYQPLRVHFSRNSGVIINAITSKSHQIVGHVLMPALNLVGSVVILISIIVAMMAINPVVAAFCFFAFVVIYGCILLFSKKRLYRNSFIINSRTDEVLNVLQKGIGGIRDILLEGNQSAYCEFYRKADRALRRAIAENSIIGNVPRYFIEAYGVCLIAGSAFYLVNSKQEITSVIPILGSMVLAAQRMLPILQQCYSSLVQMKGAQIILLEILDLLNQPPPAYACLPKPTPISFLQTIQLRDLSYRYGSDLPWALRDVQLDIPKGSRLGIIGKTGSGKSTLLDIIMGLIEPERGKLLIDGVPITAENNRSWQRHLAHVPQMIFLADTTIAGNIAFGVAPQDIDVNLLRESATKACIAEMIESMPEKYATLVGESGVRLSGGQRQRIGIARALYKKADVIVFDEATSALDSETEREVMSAIENLGDHITLLIVAHRVATLEKCTHFIEVSEACIRPLKEI
jgi:ABC-type multidrug transport system fused ATPase/permease subunit